MNKNLPVFNKRLDILKSVKENDITIITAETGSGKSTQIPQYLLAEGYKVIVTEPRRIAAVSLANRVADEVFDDSDIKGYPSDVIGYKTAFESTDTENTRVLFCTDGLKVARGMSQSKDTVLVIDEVHEWNLNIETLVAWVRHWNMQKETGDHKKVKVIIMSATMDASSLKEFYAGNSVSIINCSGTLYDVKMYDRSEYDVLDTVIELYNSGKNVLVFEPGKSEIQELINSLRLAIGNNAIILPMHSELSMSEQNKVFKHYKSNKIVVSTNIAQTSVTIPDIDAVVDTGTEKVIDTVGGIEGLFQRDISKADCRQRAGRAGRTRKGVYYLCSKCEYNSRAHFSPPEIQRLVLDKVVLKLFSVGIDPRHLEFYHHVERSDVENSIRVLQSIGALTNKMKLTEDGRKISGMPVSVRYGRMLLEAEKLGCLRDMIRAVSILEIGSMVNSRKVNESSWTGRRYGYSDFTDEHSSDVLAELDIYKNALNNKYPNLGKCGINANNFFKVKEMEKKLSYIMSDVLNKEPENSNLDAYNFRCCILCGFADNIFKEEYSFRGTCYVDLNGVAYRQDKKSCTFGGDLLVGIPKIITYKDRYGGTRSMNLVSMCTGIESSMLQKALGDRVSVEDDLSCCRFNEYSESFEVERVYSYCGSTILRKVVKVKMGTDLYTKVVNTMKEDPYFSENYYVLPNGVVKKVHSPYSSLGYINVTFDELSMLKEPVECGNGVLVLSCDGFKSCDPDNLRDKVVANTATKLSRELEGTFITPSNSLTSVCSRMIPECGARVVTDDFYGISITLYVGLRIVDGCVSNAIFDSESLANDSSVSSLQFLIRRHIDKNYPNKRFIDHSGNGGENKFRKSEEAKALFNAMCQGIIQGVTLSNFDGVESDIMVCYNKAIARVS